MGSAWRAPAAQARRWQTCAGWARPSRARTTRSTRRCSRCSTGPGSSSGARRRSTSCPTTCSTAPRCGAAAVEANRRDGRGEREPPLDPRVVDRQRARLGAVGAGRGRPGPRDVHRRGRCAMIRRLDDTRLMAIDRHSRLGEPPYYPALARASTRSASTSTSAGTTPAAPGLPDSRTEDLLPWLDGSTSSTRAPPSSSPSTAPSRAATAPSRRRAPSTSRPSGCTDHAILHGSRPYINGSIVWALKDFRVHPSWGGGNPMPAPPWNNKGLIHEQGSLKPAFYAAGHAVPAGPTSSSSYAAAPVKRLWQSLGLPGGRLRERRRRLGRRGPRPQRQARGGARLHRQREGHRRRAERARTRSRSATDPDTEPRIEFFVTSGEAEGRQFQGNAQGAEHIGNALLFVRDGRRRAPRRDRGLPTGPLASRRTSRRSRPSRSADSGTIAAKIVVVVGRELEGARHGHDRAVHGDRDVLARSSPSTRPTTWAGT